MRNTVFTLFLCLLVSGCMTLPVTGKIGDNKFLGQATGYMTRTGKLRMATDYGVSCEGVFEYTGGAMGKGEFSCNNGDIGSFNFTSSGNSGEGFGKTESGKPFEFFFGNPTSIVRVLGN